MSSKRGRKRNDNLPPNRARDVQRAFRARRAAHLEALEQRVAELEDENNTLRAALNLPPASRPPLGKGPTGKDKPKSGAPAGLQIGTAVGLPPISSLNVSPPSALASASRTDSPSSTSTRTHSLSPNSLNTALANQLSGNNSWEPDNMFKDSSEAASSSTLTSYTIPPVPPQHQAQAPTFPASSSRQTLDDIYNPSVSMQGYGHSPERPSGLGGAAGEYSGPGSDFLERRPFSYSQPSFPTHANPLHAHQGSAISPSMGAPPHGGLALDYAHRRSITEPHAYRTALGQNQMPSIPQMRLPQPPSLAGRLPSPSQLASPGGHAGGYDFNGERRLDRMR
ncbi:hypothetical protein WOLCODRAFT_17633 [Wolfiporia cocos MD-104 SS10]|uniref:BZIP domain-containing protein n=1 Tax=Wolfiporia cocos (strain MD-104) TaxID=742152 RepID=A0A2H3JR03_WOLCO|nr:hypothetical protein WOLCODRAFT_17633 [Wolfiporia cocos MD-104 SS10]